jgi:hypothetical protein
MDKREFIQRYMIQNYDVNMYHDIELAGQIFDAIEENLAKVVSSTNLWDYNDK